MLREAAPRAKYAALLLLVSLLVGCAHVAPYDRERLAHPTMARSDAESRAQAHVHGVHEGAIGGTPGASSGCGCN